MIRDDSKRVLRLEKQLSHLRFQQIRAQIEKLGTESLVVLLNSKSRRVGGTAFSCLHHRKDGEKAVAQAVLDGRLTHRDARVRGVNFFTFLGRKTSRAMEVYFRVLEDRSAEVADNALFGIVFAQNPKALPRLRQRLGLLPNGWLRDQIAAAISAIERENPFLYSSGYSPREAGSRWGIKDADQKSREAERSRQHR